MIPHAGELKVEGTFPRDIVAREGGTINIVVQGGGGFDPY